MPRGHNANRDSQGRYASGSDPGPGLPPSYSGTSSSGGGASGCLVLIMAFGAASPFFGLAIVSFLNLVK